jgi:ribosomal protein L37E
MQFKFTLTYVERLKNSGSHAILKFCAKTSIVKNEQVCCICGYNMHLIKKKIQGQL